MLNDLEQYANLKEAFDKLSKEVDRMRRDFFATGKEAKDQRKRPYHIFEIDKKEKNDAPII
ncbi:MAG TPA: hypothetical protein VE223_07570 [Nitrososphaeraceae archaeon]|nr:hypothetical protein [Nitrososphaeraceae archaeon]